MGVSLELLIKMWKVGRGWEAGQGPVRTWAAILRMIDHRTQLSAGLSDTQYLIFRPAGANILFRSRRAKM